MRYCYYTNFEIRNVAMKNVQCYLMFRTCETIKVKEYFINFLLIP